MSHQLIAVIEAGTNHLEFCVYALPNYKLVCRYEDKQEVLSPQDGWFEHDPMDIMTSINLCSELAIKELRRNDFTEREIVGIAVTNNRETIVAWDAVTSKPLCNAILWRDMRTASLVKEYIKKAGSADKFQIKTGLPISTYFSALKMRWLIDNVPQVQEACEAKRCKMGTIDSWIVWQLTSGEAHVTDVTNASRTMLMNLETLQWDSELLEFFGISIELLPSIRSNSEIYGTVMRERSWLHGCKIAAMIGNQQASLLGQYCVKPGLMKCTYHSSAFVICNTGQHFVISENGLLSTVAYKLGPGAPTYYALEGGIACAGHAFTWFTNQVHLLEESENAEKVASSVPNSGGVYFVPALRGLYAPYWKQSARGLLIGLTQFTTANHIIRATVESICFQCDAIIRAIARDMNLSPQNILADGPGKNMNLLMNLQADISGMDVKRYTSDNSVSLGAAYCVALAKSIELAVYNEDNRFFKEGGYDTFRPTTNSAERIERFQKWDRAVERSFNWVSDDQDDAHKSTFRPTMVSVTGDEKPTSSKVVPPLVLDDASCPCGCAEMDDVDDSSME